jgi:hypothetical protein
MNTLYAVAVLEGYLSQHDPLPPMVQQALTLLKDKHQTEIAPGIASATIKKKKKHKLTKEQRERQLAQLARMRDLAMQKREAQKSVQRAA